MNVLLLQIDGRFPNLALMRIASHHFALGDAVALRHAVRPESVHPGLFDTKPDRIYASLIFERSRIIAERVRQVYPDALIGGTGWDLTTTLEGIGIPESVKPDYSLWPNCTASIGFTQRGCRLSCSFCVVPAKEGRIRPTSTVYDIWRGEPWPRHLILLDNDFFGNPNWRDRIAEMREGGFAVNFNQGINARFLNDESADAIASVDYRDATFKRSRLYSAWDSRKDEVRLFAGLECLKRAGVSPGNITVYILIGYWSWETEEDCLYRVRKLREWGADPYPMPFVRNHFTRGLQRWCVGHYDRTISWEDWKRADCEPRKLGRERIPLPLFEETNS